MKKMILGAAAAMVTATAAVANPTRPCEFPGQLLPDNTDCAVYYICDANLTPQYNTCPPGLVYNHATQTCDFAENVDCN